MNEDTPYRRKTRGRTVLSCQSSTHESGFPHYSSQRERISVEGKQSKVQNKDCCMKMSYMRR